MFRPDSYEKFKKFDKTGMRREASHPCRCACGCRRKIHDDHDEQCSYCKTGQCTQCDKCGGTGYIWDNDKQESLKCGCQK